MKTINIQNPSLLNNVLLSVFGAGSQAAKRKAGFVYWLMDEDEESTQKSFAIVKFYNQRNELMHIEKVEGVNSNYLSEEAISKLNQLQKTLLKKAI